MLPFDAWLGGTSRTQAAFGLAGTRRECNKSLPRSIKEVEREFGYDRVWLHMATREKDASSSHATSAEQWGRGLRRGDAEAVRFVRERVRRILSCRRLAMPSHEREDLEQEIMSELWQSVNRSGFDFTAGFWGFVETVASRRCIDRMRARRSVVPLADVFEDRGRDPLAGVLDEERSELASRVLAELSPDCRKIIMMRLHDALPYREIARILGKSEGAVRVQLFRCIRAAGDVLMQIDPTFGRRSGGGRPDGSL